MKPGTTTGPGEGREKKLDRRPEETSDHGQQVRYTRKFCDDTRNNPTGLKGLIDAYHKGEKTKDNLRDAFRNQLKSISATDRKLMGFISAGPDVTEAEIDTFLSDTGCFDNQFMAQIESDIRAKNKAKEDMIENCIEVAQDEYGDFDSGELKNELKKEDTSRLRTFLKNPKYRKTYISKLPGSRALKEKDFNDIDFNGITLAISKLDKTNPKRREIQEAWLKISQVAHPEKDLAGAFSDITHGGGPKVDIGGAYGAFFDESNTLISRENREKILNFLTRQYVPLVPFGVLDIIDKKTSKKLLNSEIEEAQITKNLPSDPLLAEAIKKDRIEQINRKYKASMDQVSTRGLPFDTKIHILSQFGSVGSAEKMLQYYRGKPDSLRASTQTEEEFREEFQTVHAIDPEKLDTKIGLIEELTAKLGHTVEGIEHFDDGCVMQLKTKDRKTGKELIGYSIIDSVPGETVDEENIIRVRFLGDNTGPLSASGLERNYTGADFYDYLHSCSGNGSIVFEPREKFESDLEKNEQNKTYPRYYTEIETETELRNQFPESTEVQSKESLDYEIDQILNPRNNNPKEAKTPEERKLHAGMIFTKITDSSIDTFQILDIDEDAGKIVLWDGWGDKNNASSKNKSRKEMSFTEFAMTIRLLKQKSKDIYRLPTKGKTFGVKEFNLLCSTHSQYEGGQDGGAFKKMSQVNISEEGNVFGQVDPKSGNFSAMPIVKIGEKKDLYIESIDGTTVTYRRGTFTQGVYDKEKDTWTQDSEFSGSPPLTMSLEMLWAYLYANPSFEFQKPIEKAKKKEKEQKATMSWWNILKHTHSLGVILHGDLWTAPFKAWEEQHHKDHAFAGKMTAALAMEKLDSGGGIMGWAMNKMEWPSLMVADGNGSFQSYLDELVNKIDGMGSYHRTRLIKKWSRKEHFPSVKFMAAMMASMKIFGNLYPGDAGDDDYKNDDGTHEWFWYNSINHALGHKHEHMPPHGNHPWPEKWIKGGYKMTKADVCLDLFNGFQHPLLKNLGRRFQKYMSAGQKDLVNGAELNLNQRITQEEKLEWMMNTALGGKIPEMFGVGTNMWLSEGYSTEISTMPYAAVLFGCRETEMLPLTREHILKEQFQGGFHIPMFPFMQNKDEGDKFRQTSVAFAHTISSDCGERLEKLIHEARHERISGRNKKWRGRFEAFWREYGKELMHKLSGMRDPMLNLMVNDPVLFDELLQKQPPEKKREYKILNEKRSVIQAYHKRLKDTYGDDPKHMQIKRGEGYYSGDHFRFREGFSNGYPMPWINWDTYLDPNLESSFGNGSGSKDGDGIFNEIKGFLESIPRLAKSMAKQMGFEGDTKIINQIAGSIYTKNVDLMKDGMEKKIDASVPKAEYCSMPAVMLGLVTPKLIKGPGDGPDEQKRYAKYFEQMKQCIEKAKKMEEEPGGDFLSSIKYRQEMAEQWSKIILGQKTTYKVSIEQIHAGMTDEDLGDNLSNVKNNTQSRLGTTLVQKQNRIDENVRRKNDSEDSPVDRTAAESDDLPPAT